MASHDYNWKKEEKKKPDGLKLDTKKRRKFWPAVEQHNREAGLRVCFDLPFIGSAGGSPDLDSFIRSLTSSLIN